MPLRRRSKPSVLKEDKTITINVNMQGALVFEEPVVLTVNKNFQGSLDMKGTLTIGVSAHVEANIIGDNVIIAGKVVGDVIARKMLVLMQTATINGNISAPKLSIVEGAIFQGKCRMNMNEGLLDIDEVSKYLEINISEIQALANCGKIPGTKQGDAWKFERSQIDHWAAEGKMG